MGAGTVALLHLDALEPKLFAFRVQRAALLQQRARLDPQACLLFEARRHDPERRRGRALSESGGERIPRRRNVGRRLRLQELGVHHVQFGRGRVDLETLLDHVERCSGVAVSSLKHGGLDPDLVVPATRKFSERSGSSKAAITHAFGTRHLASALHELLRRLDLTILGLQLDRREPDALAVRVRLERAAENLPRAVDVAGVPRLLGGHEPEHFGLRNRFDCPFEEGE